MKYAIDPWVFEKNQDVCFGIIIGKGLKNTSTTEADSQILKQSEEYLKTVLTSDTLKTYPPIAVYRDALKTVNINSNKYMNSVEAMCKRVIKGGGLPRINALVDLCNAISLREVVSLGAHDLSDIKQDLEVRLSRSGDTFLPFAAKETEDVPEGELVFTSGNEIQTRQWLWRQSELGKITEESQDIFFQIVGFKGEYYSQLTSALEAVEELVKSRFGGTTQTFMVDKTKTEIEF